MELLLFISRAFIILLTFFLEVVERIVRSVVENFFGFLHFLNVVESLIHFIDQ